MQQIGKFTVSEKIGEGGFGSVFKGLDPFIKRPVAIKTCNADDDETRSRFTREAQIAGNLHHRHIVTIYDFGVQDGVPYLVQEYLSGEDLDHKIKRGDPIAVDEKVLYLLQVARGLHYAHEHGVIHRDIKPANIRVLDDGTAKILDFGIAKLATQQTVLTQTGVTLGTAAYLAPEQIQDTPVDHRTDIFSFGTLAYELLTYGRPFPGSNMSHVLYRILHDDPPAVNEVVGDCPAELADIVNRCLAKSPDDRYGDCGALEDDLSTVLAQLKEPKPVASATPASATAETLTMSPGGDDRDTAEIELDRQIVPPGRPRAGIGDFDLRGPAGDQNLAVSYGSGMTRHQRGFRWKSWVVFIALLVAALGAFQHFGGVERAQILIAELLGQPTAEIVEPSDEAMETSDNQRGEETGPVPNDGAEETTAPGTETGGDRAGGPAIEPEPEPPPPPPEPATLVLTRAWSGATMVKVAGETYRMDGERSLELEAGTYTLRFSYRSGNYRDVRTKTLELSEGESHRVSSPIPKPGRLTIQKGLQSPVGQVVLDGTSVGGLPRQQLTRPGKHTIRVERKSGEGDAIQETIVVEPGKHVIVTFDLAAGTITRRVRDD